MSTITESNITLRPVDVFYGDREKWTVTFVADSGGSLNSTYFTFQNTDIDGTTTNYYVWFDINSAGVDPAVSGSTGITVAGATGVTAATLAAAVVTAIDASAARVSAVQTSGVLTLEMGAMGAVADVADGGAATSFTFASVTAGQKLELGATEDVELSTSFSLVEVTASQLGETRLDAIQNGSNITISVPAKEVTASLLQEMLGEVAGDTRTVGSDTIVGIGESQRFVNMKARSKELFLRPANEATLANAVCVWAAYPDLTGLNYSGSELQVLQIEFSAFRDSNRPTTVSVAAFGKSDKKMLA